MIRSRLVNLALLSVPLLACADHGLRYAPGDVVERMIGSDPEILLSFAELYDLEPVFAVDLCSDADPVELEGRNLRIGDRTGDGTRVEPEAPDPQIIAAMDIDADAVHVIEIDLAGFHRESLQIYWRGAHQLFSEKRSVKIDAGSGPRESPNVFRFELIDHPEWRGIVTHLRFDPPGDSGESFRIRSIRGLRRVLDGDRVASAVARPWKIDLDHDARNALLAPPGLTRKLQLKTPSNASLRVAYGVPATLRTPVRFTITAVGPEHRPVTILEDVIDPVRSDRGGRWIDEVVELSGFSGADLTLELTTEAGDRFSGFRGFPAWANPEVVAPNAHAGPPNVVVICLDTLRADRLSAYGCRLPTSPNIDRWAAESGVIFRNTVTGAPWTLPSHASIFTGLDAVRHGVNFSSPAPPGLHMLAESLRRDGYLTAAVTGGGYLHPRYGYAQGFDTFQYWPTPEAKEELDWVTGTALRWLDANRDRRFFLFIHTYEIHYPHRRRQPYFDRLAAEAGVQPAPGTVQMRSHGWQGLLAPGDYFVIRRPGSADWESPLTDAEKATVNLMYDSAVAYADSAVGRVLDSLSGLGLKGRTLVILTSDHGEALGEDDRAGHAYLEDYNLMVPLVIEFPDQRRAGAVIDHQVRLVDLMPTVLDVVGSEPDVAIDGQSLLPLVADPSAAFPDRAWAYAGSSNRGLALRVDNQLKYVFPDVAWPEADVREQLFDLEADPAEKHDLAPADPRLAGLRETTRATILDEHRGVRLRLVNRGDRRLEGRLLGAWASHDRVKTADHECDCVHWTPGEPAAYELDPGRETTLLIGRLGISEVGIQGHLVDPDGAGVLPFQETFDLETVVLPAAIHLTSSGWRMVEGFEGEITTGFLVTRVGDAPPVAADPTTTDPELLVKLKALGYVR